MEDVARTSQGCVVIPTFALEFAGWPGCARALDVFFFAQFLTLPLLFPHVLAWCVRRPPRLLTRRGAPVLSRAGRGADARGLRYRWYGKKKNKKIFF